jgi:hypothetical protein
MPNNQTPLHFMSKIGFFYYPEDREGSQLIENSWFFASVSMTGRGINGLGMISSQF